MAPSDDNPAPGACPEHTTLDALHRAALDPATQAAVKRHVAACGRCAAVVRLFAEGEEMAELLKEARHETPADFRERLIRHATRLGTVAPPDDNDPPAHDDT